MKDFGVRGELPIYRVLPEKDDKLLRPVGKYRSRAITLRNNISSYLAKRFKRPRYVIKFARKLLREWVIQVKKRGVAESSILIAFGVFPYLVLTCVIDSSRAYKTTKKKMAYIPPEDISASTNIKDGTLLREGIHPDVVELMNEGRIKQTPDFVIKPKKLTP